MPTGGRIDLTGKTFGRLTVIKYAYTQNGRRAMWECLCICGKSVVTRASGLTLGHTKSCGCYNRDINSERTKTHGKSKTPEYHAYRGMIDRCTKPNCYSYHCYGGRGITICKRWLGSFDNFLSDVGLRPGKGYSLDRIDVNGNYCPENIRWATIKEQAANTRKNVRYIYNGESYIQSDFAKLLGANDKSLPRLIKRNGFEKTVEYYLKKQSHGSKNRYATIFIEYRDTHMPLVDFCRIIGAQSGQYLKRIKQGWDINKIAEHYIKYRNEHPLAK